MPRKLPEKTWLNLYYPPADYKYFELAQQYPFPAPLQGDTTLSYVKAAWAADAAVLAYGRRGQNPIPRIEFAGILQDAGFGHNALIGDWSAGARGTQGFIAYNDTFAIMAFRGTERDDPTDLETDVSALLVDEEDYRVAADDPGKALRHLSIIEGLFHQCRVHMGFQRALNDVWEEVHEWLSGYRNSHPDSEICFTGHSLGAALATLAVSRFGGGNASLYTFGSPRVGNAQFGQRVCDTTGQRVFRFVNGYDPVTHVPIESRLYQHTSPDCLHIDANGGIQASPEAPEGDWSALAQTLRGLPRAGLPCDLGSPAPEALADHSPARYSIQIWNYVELNVPAQ